MPSDRIQRQIDEFDEAAAAVKRAGWVLVREQALSVLALTENEDARTYSDAAEFRLSASGGPRGDHFNARPRKLPRRPTDRGRRRLETDDEVKLRHHVGPGA